MAKPGSHEAAPPGASIRTTESSSQAGMKPRIVLISDLAHWCPAKRNRTAGAKPPREVLRFILCMGETRVLPLPINYLARQGEGCKPDECSVKGNYLLDWDVDQEDPTSGMRRLAEQGFLHARAEKLEGVLWDNVWLLKTSLYYYPSLRYRRGGCIRTSPCEAQVHYSWSTVLLGAIKPLK